MAAPALIGHAKAEPITLKMHHFLPATTSGATNLLAPWARRVEAQSGGRLKIDIYPSMQLGGTPSQLFDQAKDGVVDMVWTLPGYTPGRFPLTEVLELPFIAASRGAANAQAGQAFANKHFGSQFQDVKLLSYWLHDGGAIHTTKPIRTLSDFKGARLRAPSRLIAETLKALGAVSIGMPVPQVPESLAQRVIDGAVLPFEVLPSVRVHELTKYHTEIIGTPALYAASFLFVMNKARYESLAPDLRAIIDAQSGMAFARLAGPNWDSETARVKALVTQRGNTMIRIEGEEKARWIEATRPVEAAFIEHLNAKGYDGKALVREARALIAQYDAA